MQSVNARLRTTLGTALLVAAPAFATTGSTGTVVSETPGAVRYQYAVSFNDRAIGTHSFEIESDGPAQRVRSAADFRVRILSIPVYEYQHRSDEVWHGGCLQSLDSETDDDGQRFQLRIEQSEQLRIQRLAPESNAETLPINCAATFAYWDLEQLERAALVNSQTGEIMPVSLHFEESETIAGASADRYRLEPGSMSPILLWYRATDGRWLQLETRRGNGTLRYQLVTVEPLVSTDTAARRTPDALTLAAKSGDI